MDVASAPIAMKESLRCKDRKNQSVLALPLSFLPTMVAKKLRDAAEQSQPQRGAANGIAMAGMSLFTGFGPAVGGLL
ncbi:hypothetical protein Scep_022324 [Stephania cephalantha]|uniref:Uncharacterized protein n=1 Tax=Stephania cephalantha TaxID=152367 RepID=A0AAP0I258_9MAGN